MNSTSSLFIVSYTWVAVLPAAIASSYLYEAISFEMISPVIDISLTLMFTLDTKEFGNLGNLNFTSIGPVLSSDENYLSLFLFRFNKLAILFSFLSDYCFSSGF